MNVAINCYFLQPGVGGVNQYLLTLIQHLPAILAGGECRLLCFPHNRPYLAELVNVEWEEHTVWLQSMGQIRHHLHGVDVYFCPINGLQPLPLPPLPTVIMLQDTQEESYPDFFSPQDLFYRDWYYRVSAFLADRILAPSTFSKDCISSFYRVPAGKITIAHHAVASQFLDTSVPGKKPAQPLPPAYAFFPANAWRHKNHDGLLRAIRWLRQEANLDIPVVCTGQHPPGGYSIQEMAHTYGVEDLIFLLDYVNTYELVYLYRNARLLVFPSFYEGFGLPLVEAMATGCPIAASNVTSLPEVGAAAALYFDPHNPPDIGRTIMRIWTEPALGAQLAAEGGRQLSRFSAQAMINAHLSAFEAAAGDFSRATYFRKMSRLPFELLRVLTKKYLRVYNRQSRESKYAGKGTLV